MIGAVTRIKNNINKDVGDTHPFATDHRFSLWWQLNTFGWLSQALVAFVCSENALDLVFSNCDWLLVQWQVTHMRIQEISDNDVIPPLVMRSPQLQPCTCHFQLPSPLQHDLNWVQGCQQLYPGVVSPRCEEYSFSTAVSLDTVVGPGLSQNKSHNNQSVLEFRLFPL